MGKFQEREEGNTTPHTRQRKIAKTGRKSIPPQGDILEVKMVGRISAEEDQKRLEQIFDLGLKRMGTMPSDLPVGTQPTYLAEGGANVVYRIAVPLPSVHQSVPGDVMPEYGTGAVLATDIERKSVV